MAATISIRVFTGANAATMSEAVSGVDFISGDNATNSSANRLANPIAAGENSYEKWIKARIDVAPDNYVKDFKVWGDGAVEENTHLYYGRVESGATPEASKSSVAIHSSSSVVASVKGDWDATERVAVGELTEYLVFQLCVEEVASPGNWTQETVNFEYTEA